MSKTKNRTHITVAFKVDVWILAYVKQLFLLTQFDVIVKLYSQQ